MRGKRFFSVLFLLMVFAGGVVLCGCKKREHPKEHPEAEEKAVGLSKDDLADAIEDYVNKTSKLYSGYFIAIDDKTDEQLQLTLDRVHRERLSRVGVNEYFACADFVTDEGKVYDLDVFMKGTNKDDLVFSEFSLHKEAGKERYTWYEEGGIWKKKFIDQPIEEPEEHPVEHPERPEEPPHEHPIEHPAEHPEHPG